MPLVVVWVFVCLLFVVLYFSVFACCCFLRFWLLGLFGVCCLLVGVCPCLSLFDVGCAMFFWFVVVC